MDMDMDMDIDIDIDHFIPPGKSKKREVLTQLG